MWSPKKIDVHCSGDADGETVILLGGLGPNLNYLGKARRRLENAGYRVVDIAYPSTYYGIRELADEHVGPAIESANIHRDRPLHFVTLSMGGIVVRAYLRSKPPSNLGRTVMIAPPNHGSEVADWLKDFFLFRQRFGPAGQELTTDPGSTPNQLGPAIGETGIIAGTRWLDPWFAWLFRGPHDGKVSVESARLEGMADFATVWSDHYLIMNNKQVLELTLHFLRTGSFQTSEAKFSLR